MRSAHALLALAALLPASGEEAKASHPPVTRELLEGLGQRKEWKPMTFKEDDAVLVGGTCDAKKVEETFGICRKALDRFCALFKVIPQDLTRKEKLWFVVVSEKREFMALASTPEYQEIYNRVAAAGNFLCIDRVYKTTPESDPHVTAHLFTHRILEAYVELKGGDKSPGWMQEGLGAWMDGVITGAPVACCIARVGYEGDELQERHAGSSWERTLAVAMKKYSAMKEKDRITAEYTPLRNMVGKPFDRLSGTDVAASWHLVQTLTGDKKKPDGFKAFVDAVLGGGKQHEAFQSAFGKTLDEYEKGWMKGLLPKAESPDPKKK